MTLAHWPLEFVHQCRTVPQARRVSSRSDPRRDHFEPRQSLGLQSEATGPGVIKSMFMAKIRNCKPVVQIFLVGAGVSTEVIWGNARAERKALHAIRCGA